VYTHTYIQTDPPNHVPIILLSMIYFIFLLIVTTILNFMFLAYPHSGDTDLTSPEIFKKVRVAAR